MRREFQLPEEDINYLNANGYYWETINGGTNKWLLIENFHIPEGYNTKEASIAIDMRSYSPGPLDMVYVYPALTRSDNKTIEKINVTVTIDNKPYQRWSRHYAWDNKCNLATHIMQIEEWFLNPSRK